MRAQVVTIDGPAASGKTSVSRELARRLSWSWISTGAFYRGLAYISYCLHADLKDGDLLAELAKSPRWKVVMSDQKTEVFFDHKDVTDFISQEQIGSIASQISHFPQVRKALLTAQRSCADRVDGLIAEGRDCGTVVFPDADAKVYLTARQEHRAERRALELGLSTSETVAAQSVRDQQDAGRKVAPLQIPEHALVLDSTDLDLNEVVDLVEKFIREQLKPKN